MLTSMVKGELVNGHELPMAVVIVAGTSPLVGMGELWVGYVEVVAILEKMPLSSDNTDQFTQVGLCAASCGYPIV